MWERVRESAMRRLNERPTPIGRWLFKCVGVGTVGCSLRGNGLPCAHNTGTVVFPGIPRVGILDFHQVSASRQTASGTSRERALVIQRNHSAQVADRSMRPALGHSYMRTSFTCVRSLFSWIKLRRLRAGVPQSKACWLGDVLIFNRVCTEQGKYIGRRPNAANNPSWPKPPNPARC